MNNLYLFGAGFYGKIAYQKLRDMFNILAFIDNNSQKIKREDVWDLPIINGSKLESLELTNADIVICVRDYDSVARQLIEAGINEYYVYYDGFIYFNSSTEIMMPVELYVGTYKKRSKSEKNILFVQDTACVRTHKIASVMKSAGYNVLLLYSILPPVNQYKEYSRIYDEIWTFSSIDGIRKFINDSEIDLVHCSNEPDVLVNIANMTNKPVVADTHDMLSTRDCPSCEVMLMEYLANSKCDGNIYTSDIVEKMARKKYGLCNKEVYVLENLILEQINVDRLNKKSNLDGEIHCVYEGGVDFYRTELPKYFENIWLRIADAGVHVHFYSINEEKSKELASKSEYIHYEGNVGGERLIQELTQYDCGLALYNITNTNKRLTETYSPNKIFEYLEAGIPVAANVVAHVDFLKKYNVGDEVDLRLHVDEQIKMIVNLDVPNDFLTKNGLSMMSRKNDLIQFYARVIEKHNES